MPSSQPYSASPNNTTPNHKQAPWFEAYQRIESLAYSIIDCSGGAEIIFNLGLADQVVARVRKAVDDLYAQHQGDPAWDTAYRRWNETMYYKEEK